LTRDFFDPPWEETDIVMVDRLTLQKAQRQLAGCEACSDDAEVPFDWVLDRITGRDPTKTDYVLETPARCLYCGRPILEKTLVDLKPDA
jgi:hypothetical protein